MLAAVVAAQSQPLRRAFQILCRGAPNEDSRMDFGSPRGWRTTPLFPHAGSGREVPPQCAAGRFFALHLVKYSVN